MREKITSNLCSKISAGYFGSLLDRRLRLSGNKNRNDLLMH
jgi:hypothetical protein